MLVVCQNYKTQNWQKKSFFLVKEVTFCDFFFLQVKFRWCITREEFIIESKSKCKNTILEEQKKHNQVELSSFEKKSNSNTRYATFTNKAASETRRY